MRFFSFFLILRGTPSKLEDTVKAAAFTVSSSFDGVPLNIRKKEKKRMAECLQIIQQLLPLLRQNSSSSFTKYSRKSLSKT